MKRKFSLALGAIKTALGCSVLLALGLQSVHAEPQVVRAFGIGETQEIAVERALEQAIAGTRGVLVNSESVLDKNELVEDRISTSTFSFVQSYRLVTVAQKASHVRVEVEAVIDANPLELSSGLAPGTHSRLEPIPQADIELSNLGTVSAQKQLNIFKSMFGDSNKQLHSAYRFELSGIRTTATAPNGVSGYYLVTATPLKAYWDRYREFFNNVSAPPIEQSDFAGLIGHDRDFPSYNRTNRDKTSCLVEYSPYQLPQFLARAEREVFKPILAEISVGNAKREVLLIKNAIVIPSELRYPQDHSDLNAKVHRSFQSAGYRLDEIIYEHTTLRDLCEPWRKQMAELHRKDSQGLMYNLPTLKNRLGLTGWEGGRLLVGFNYFDSSAIMQVADLEPSITFMVPFHGVLPDQLNAADERFAVKAQRIRNLATGVKRETVMMRKDY